MLRDKFLFLQKILCVENEVSGSFRELILAIDKEEVGKES